MTDVVMSSDPLISTSIGLRIEQYRWLQQRAKDTDLSVSEIVRGLIEAARKQEAA